MAIKVDVLRVEAWRNECGTWDWNAATYTRVQLDIPEDKWYKPRYLAQRLRDEGMLTEYSKGRIRFDIGDTIIEVQEKGTGAPILALQEAQEVL